MKKVLLAQLPHPSIVDRNVPLAAGYLKAYAAQAGLLDVIGIDILDGQSNRSGCKLILDKLVAIRPDVIGFSLYLWNVDRTLNLINKLRAALPELLVVVGGPEVTPSFARLFALNGIDIFVFGEGEISFVEILKFLIGDRSRFDDIAGIGYRQKDDVVINRPGNRIEDLETIPSPYLLGFIDLSSYREIMLFTMRGCLQGCSYCSWSGRGRLRAFSLDRLRKELELVRSNGQRMSVSIIDSAFNTSPLFDSLCYTIKEINQDGLLSFNCFVRADMIDRKSARLLKESNFTGVEVGLQTTNKKALVNIQRSMDLERFLRGIRLLTEEGVPIKVDTILGLPGDTSEDFNNTMQFVNEHQLDPIIFNLSLGYGSRLRKRTKQFGFRIQSAPPYYVLETNTLSRKDLQISLEHHVGASADFDLMTNLNYPVISLNMSNVGRGISDLDALSTQAADHPIRSIVILIDERISPTAVSFEDLANFIARRTATNFSVLLKGPMIGLTSSLGWLKILLSKISEMNPFITWDIHIEPQEGVLTQSFINEIRSFIHKPRVFLDFRDELFSSEINYARRRAVNLFVYSPYSLKNTICLDNASIIYLVDINKDNVEQVNILDATSATGLLIDYMPGTSVDVLNETMQILNNHGNKVFFKDWVIQRYWEQQFLHITPERQSRFEIMIDHDFNLVSHYFDENEIVWDAIFRWKMIKQEYSNIDLLQHIIEKVSMKVKEIGTC